MHGRITGLEAWRWEGEPKGWLLYDGWCGHNHGVRRTKFRVWREMIFCYMKPWGWHPYFKGRPTLFAPVSFKHNKEVFVNDRSKERSFSLTAFYRNISFSYSSPLRKKR